MKKATRFQSKPAQGEADAIKPEINVVFITDENYVTPTCVAVTSLIENSDKTREYYIRILTAGVSKKNTSVLNQLDNLSGNATVELLACDEHAAKLAGLHNPDGNIYISASTTALLKFLIPEIFYEIDKMLYLDSDVIIKDSLTELFDINIDNYFIAAVRDLPQVIWDNPIMGTEINGKDYINSGVMLMNLKKMRENASVTKLIETKRDAEDSTLMDQNTINIVFKSAILQLPFVYNLCYSNFARSKLWRIEKLNELYKTAYVSLEDIVIDAKIIHLSSRAKPWLFYSAYFSDEWIYYYYRSPLRDIALHRLGYDNEAIIDIADSRAKLEKIKSIAVSDKQIIPIVLCSNEEYIPYAGTAIKSVLENSSDKYFYDIYIFHDENIFYSLQYRLHNIVSEYENARLSFADVRLLNTSSSLYSRAHYSKQMYYRWYIPEVLTQYDKVIYLDCDLVVIRDISALFNIDLGGKLIGAVNNFVGVDFLEKNLNHQVGVSKEEYINSGVLVIDTKQWISRRIKERLLRTIACHSKFWCPDQDALNIVCQGMIHYLPDNWNYQWQHEWPEHKGQYLVAPYDKRFKAVKDNPWIIHYTSYIKPWKEPSKRLADYFWQYARETPYYERIVYGALQIIFNRDRDKNDSDDTLVKLNAELVATNNELAFCQRRITELTGMVENILAQNQNDVKILKKSITYRLGEIILWLPKKIKTLPNKLIAKKVK